MLYVLCEKFYGEMTLTKMDVLYLEKEFNLKKTAISVVDSIDAAYSVLQDKEAVLYIPYAIDGYKRLIVDCSNCNIPVVVGFNHLDEFYDIYCNKIMSNMNYAALSLLKYFKQYNKKRVAFFGANVRSDSDRKKVISLYSCLSNFDSCDVFYNEQYIEACFEKFYEKRYEYDAIVCAHDFCAMAFVELMNKKDPDYLKDRFVIGFSNKFLSRIFSYPITTISFEQKNFVDALYSIYRVLKKIKCHSTLNVMLKTCLLIRSSTLYQPYSNATDNEIPVLKRNEFVFPQFDTEVNFSKDNIICKYQKIENLLHIINITDLKIIYYMLQGLKNKEISSKIFIAEQTIKVYQRKILKKANVTDKQELLDLLTPYISLKYLGEYIKECEG